LIAGPFVKAAQGSRAARAAVGSGLGRTWFETEVSVHRNLNGESIPMFDFETAGSSGRILGRAVGLAVLGGVLDEGG